MYITKTKIHVHITLYTIVYICIVLTNNLMYLSYQNHFEDEIMKHSTTGHKLSFKFFQFHKWNLRQLHVKTKHVIISIFYSYTQLSFEVLHQNSDFFYLGGGGYP